MNKEFLSRIITVFNSVRKLIAMLLTVTFCIMSIRGLVGASEFVSVFSMVVGFYFGRSTALDIPGKREKAMTPEEDDLK